MFRKMYWWAGVLAAALMGGTAQARMDYAPPDPVLPIPLYSTRPEDGGFYAGLDFTLYRISNALVGQPIAVRGFLDVDGSISNAINPGGGFQPHTFFGSGTTALDAQQVTGPNSYTPGFKVELGWKFGDGSAITFGWMHFFNYSKTAVATLVPPNLNPRADLADSFLFSPVINFPSQFAGPTSNGGDVSIPGANPTATYGIWNAASLETIQLTTKYQQFDLTFRQVALQDDCYRLNGIMGPRFAWIWEQFRWATYDADSTGATDPSTTAIYTNITSNRMYGAFIGLQGEYYLGHGFAAMLEGEGSMYLDIVKKRAQYELGPRLPPKNKRNLTTYTIAPELSAKVELMWYTPVEGVQVRLSYNLMAFFNTVSMQQAVDFDYSALTPTYTSSNIRYFDGIEAAIAFVF